jgi:hypothetical protein
MHNDLTLDHMDSVTTLLGKKLRHFRDKTCANFITRELCREAAARMRREGRKSAAKCPQTHGNSEAHNVSRSERRPKTLNLNTYKVHALGDYTASIRQYGTTDSYSTAPVRIPFSCSSQSIIHNGNPQGELEHRTPKARYTRTSRKDFIKQLTQIERRQARIRRIRERCQKEGRSTSEKVASTVDSHHVIAKSQNHPESIPIFLQKNAGDPAVKVCAIL